MDPEFDPNQLFPKDVRRIAASVPRCKEMKTNGHPDVLSFMLIDEMDEPARIQVYCTTGTIGVCRVVCREVREIFHRKCTLRQVHEIFNCPMDLPNVDPDMFNAERQDERNPRDGNHDDHRADRDNRNDLQKDGQMVDVGLTILASEFDNLMSHFKSLLRERQRKEKRLEEMELAKQRQLQQNLNPRMHQHQQQRQQMMLTQQQQQQQRQQQMHNGQLQQPQFNPQMQQQNQMRRIQHQPQNPQMAVQKNQIMQNRQIQQQQQQQVKMQIYQPNNNSPRNNNMQQFKKQQMREQMRQIRQQAQQH